MKLRGVYILTFFCLALVIGCSNTDSPTTPDIRDQRQAESGYNLWAAVNFSWDGESEEVTMVPNRLVAKHHNITKFANKGNISIKIINWDPGTRILTVEVTLENTLPIEGYDVRGILINLGERKHLNPDDYTKIFNPNDPQVANPFRAFAKDEPNRRFGGKFTTPEEHIKTEIYEIYFPGPIEAEYIVTASWPDNAQEPYDIVSIDQVGSIIEDEGSIDVTIEVLDWQDVTASDVVLLANPVTGSSVHLTLIDDTHWETTITNTGGALPGDYEIWVEAQDAVSMNSLYNVFTVTVEETSTATWGPPILVSGVSGVDEILPRIVSRSTDMWIIYTDGTACLARQSTDDGDTWSASTTIGTYSSIDSVHAALGGDNSIYVEYQWSGDKPTFISAYQGGVWLPPVQPNLHSLTTGTKSCDFGVGSDGTLFAMWNGTWSLYGFHTTVPYDISTFTWDNIGPLYNADWSVNDGFVQNADVPKVFYVHDSNTLDYAWFNDVPEPPEWNYGAALTGSEDLIEPSIAPESDNPYHGVMAVNRGSNFDVQYFRFNNWPPSSPSQVSLSTGLTSTPIFHSISVEGDLVSVFYEADGDLLYAESTNGGTSFATPEDLGDGSYAQIRHDGFGPAIVAAYTTNTSGDNDIYIRIKE